jgi:hypothetical protein
MVGFPLLLIPLAIYNIIVFLMPGVSFTEPLDLKLTLMSGAEWTVTLSDVLLTLAILLLLAEVIKGARPGAKYLTDHLLSLIVFGAAAAEFVLWPKFGTSTYFLLTVLALVDFLSGLALRTRRRAVAVAAAPAPAPAPQPKATEPPPKAAEKVETPAAEPKLDPAPAAAPAPAAPSVPPAVSVAESVLKDLAEPKPVQPAVAPEAAPPKTPSPEVHSPEAHSPEVSSPEVSPPEVQSPEVPSPGLQPGPGFPPPPDKPDTPQR